MVGMDKDSFFKEKIPKTSGKKAKIEEWNFINLKSFCTVVKMINHAHRQSTEWKKIFVIYTTGIRIISKSDTETKPWGSIFDQPRCRDSQQNFKSNRT